MTIPDLLCHTPTRRLDARRTSQALTFAFAQGIPDSTWESLLEKATLPETTLRPDGFSRDLFVAELVTSCATIEIDGSQRLLCVGWLGRLLSHPPKEEATIALRHAVLAELMASPAAERELSQLYEQLRRVRDLLGVTPGRSTDVLRRRLEILGAVRDIVAAMAEAFPGATSALARVRAFAAEVQESDAYRALVELLAYDNHLATVDVQVRVGADGRVRGLSLARVRENTASRFARTPLGRWIARILLVFRGYKFDAEQLIAGAIEQVYEGLEDVLAALFQLSGDLELYLAALRLRARAERAGLAVCIPALGDTRSLEGLFNPLLLPHEKRVVPCDLKQPRPDLMVLVTGPNSGGKTRLLQAIGLTQLLAQCGFLVPAASATIRPVDSLFVSFGQAPAADASEGRLGTELLRVRALFETLSVGGMVLVDELCSGTNPSEGEELFRHVVELLAQLEPQAFLSTHFLTLAADIERAPPNDRLAFLQVELDPAGVPTYGFVPGVAKTSLAHRTAARLGVTRDDLAALVQRAVKASQR